MKRKYMFTLWLFLMVTVSLYGLCRTDEGIKNQYEGVIRFHVIANSDSEEDQALKLLVRDSVVTKLQSALQQAEDAEDSRRYIEENMETINSWAAECVKEQNYEYQIKTRLGVTAIPARHYDDIFFPAGNYEALTITIGEGKGRNWWCVIFPPLCLVEGTGEESLLPGEDGQLVLKSRLLEILSRKNG